MFLGNKTSLYNRQSHKHPKRVKEGSLRPHGTRNGKPGTVVDFSASQDHMVSHFCICLRTGFPLSKAINVFLPVTLACMCQLLIYDLMSLMFTPFDCSACAFSLDSSGYSLIGLAWGRYVLVPISYGQRGLGLIWRKCGCVFPGFLTGDISTKIQ